MLKYILDLLGTLAFALTMLAFGMVYGTLGGQFAQAPRDFILDVFSQVTAVRAMFKRHEAIDLPAKGPGAGIVQADAMAPGLVMVAAVNEAPLNVVRVINRDGSLVHEWLVDWFEVWPDADFAPSKVRPLSQPGTLLHGTAIAPNGDLIANFEHLSTVRLNACGTPRWKLPNLGHHSVEIAEDGTIWVGAEAYYDRGEQTPHQNHTTPLRDWHFQQISAEGEILRSVSIIDVLVRNDLLGLLSLSTLENTRTLVSGDTLHLNDVEVFPASLESGAFQPGDIMLSLRNINTVLVIDPDTLRVKFQSTGAFLRHHDPDFISGDRISLFDNRNILPSRTPIPQRSRILEIDARTGAVEEVFAGDTAYFTAIMGKHQRLANGNVLVTSSWEGRVIEIAPDGSTVWEHANQVDGDFRGVVTQATVLPPEMDRAFFERAAAACQTAGDRLSRPDLTENRPSAG